MRKKQTKSGPKPLAQPAPPHPAQSDPPSSTRNDRPRENTLQQGEARFRALVETASDWIWEVDRDGIYTYASPKVRELLGYDPEEVVGKTPFDFMLPEEAARLRPIVAASWAATKPFVGLENVNRHKDGRLVLLETSGNPIFDENGKLLGYRGVDRDITERKRAEEASRESEERYRRLFELESDAILLVDSADGQVLEVNAAAEALYGYGRDEWMRLKVTDLSTEPEKTRQVMVEEHRQVPLRQHRRKDGTIFSVEVTLSFFDWHGRRVHIAAIRDVTERVRTAERVRQLSSLKQQLLVARSLPDRLRLITDGVVAAFGADIARIWMIEKGDLCELGCRHAVVHEGLDACPDHTRCLHLMASSGRDTRIDDEHRRIPLGVYRIGRVAAGSEPGFVTNEVVHDPMVRDRAWAESLGLVSFVGRRLIAPDGQPVGVLAFFGQSPIPAGEQDLLDDVAATASQVIATAIAERQQREFEARMQQVQKLESLGVLAGGIAHDFNNLLTAILGNANLARMDLAPESLASTSLREIESASGRAAELCRQMLAYAGQGRFAVEPVNLSRLIQELANLLGVSISKKALLRTNLPEDLPAIEADAAQVRQVAMNLVTNASEAIGDTEGVITISTGVRECDEAYLRRNHPVEHRSPGKYVYLEVLDTGCGMDAGTQAKIFDPFFTTKFTGRGLGLAAVQGIIRKHNGLIEVESARGRGTTFRVLFPVSVKGPAPAAPKPEAPPGRGHGTILVVDDEDPVRLVAARVLERCGFDVLSARDGQEAVDLFRKQAGEIAGVLLDLTMPRMDGAETYQELRRIRPDVRVILASGYSTREIAQRFAGSGVAGFIQKPYDMDVLRTRLHEALTAGPASVDVAPPEQKIP